MALHVGGSLELQLEVKEEKSQICPACGSLFSNAMLLEIHMELGNCSARRPATLEEQASRTEVLEDKPEEKVGQTCGSSFFNKALLVDLLKKYAEERSHAQKCQELEKEREAHPGTSKVQTPAEKMSSVQPKTSSCCGKARPESLVINVRPKSALCANADKKKIHEPHLCHVCGEIFELKSALTLHLRLHSKERKKQTFGTKVSLRMKVHCKGRPHKRSSCEESFGKESELRAHGVTHSNKAYSCDVCTAAFNRKSSLTMHLRLHGRDKPFVCEVCGKRFVVKFTLQEHRLTHTGERPHVCEVCGKTFVQKGVLQRHMRSHARETTHTCEVCGKAFATKRYLNEHKKIHSGKKHVVCAICGKAFRQKDRLIGHMRVHTGEKPYTCVICGKGFALRSNLTPHVRIHTGEKPYVCKICGKGFSQHSPLKRHVKKVHAGRTYGRANTRKEYV